MVSRPVRDREIAGSNPAFPITQYYQRPSSRIRGVIDTRDADVRRLRSEIISCMFLAQGYDENEPVAPPFIYRRPAGAEGESYRPPFSLPTTLTRIADAFAARSASPGRVAPCPTR